MWLACKVTETRTHTHTHTIFENCFKIDQFHLICKMIYGNAYRNWETSPCLLCHYNQFSQIICIKALRKLILFCSSAGWGTLHADQHTFFIVAGDKIFYQSIVVQHSVVLHSRQWCVTQQHAHNSLLCSSCNNGYKDATVLCYTYVASCSVCHWGQ